MSLTDIFTLQSDVTSHQRAKRQSSPSWASRKNKFTPTRQGSPKTLPCTGSLQSTSRPSSRKEKRTARDFQNLLSKSLGGICAAGFFNTVFYAPNVGPATLSGRCRFRARAAAFVRRAAAREWRKKPII